jgi:DNA processing protein
MSSSRDAKVDRAHWVALATIPGVGGKTIQALREHFGELDDILGASSDELRKVRGVGPKISQAIQTIDLAQVEADIARFEAEGIQTIIAPDYGHYPAQLRRGLADWPPVLFARGTLVPRIQTPAVAIVGSRWPRPERRTLAHAIAVELARRGLAIVSGLALGVDAAAHRGALDAGGRTLAVLGCGLKRIYPEENASLVEDIVNDGAVLSEIHPELPVAPQKLVARNRIISGLSQAVIVVEAGQDSGSLIAARRAWDQGRVVFAVAGGDVGCDALIADGAEAIEVEEINWDELARRIAKGTVEHA